MTRARTNSTKGDRIAPSGPARLVASDLASHMKVRLTVKDQTLIARLIDSPSTRDFLSLLPLTLTMNDLFKREKFALLPRALSTEGKHTHSYALGDIAYWPPGPDIAIFYHHDGEPIPDPGIIVIGKIGSGLHAIGTAGAVKVTIESMSDCS